MSSHGSYLDWFRSEHPEAGQALDVLATAAKSFADRKSANSEEHQDLYFSFLSAFSAYLIADLDRADKTLEILALLDVIIKQREKQGVDATALSMLAGYLKN